jgi:hypothetical protein
MKRQSTIILNGSTYIPEDKSELPRMDVCFHVISSNQALEESSFGSDSNEFGTQTFQ